VLYFIVLVGDMMGGYATGEEPTSGWITVGLLTVSCSVLIVSQTWYLHTKDILRRVDGVQEITENTLFVELPSVLCVTYI